MMAIVLARSRRLSSVLLAGATLLPLPAGAQQAPVPCTITRITRIVMPTGPARYQSGRMTLANGATLELSGPIKSPAMYQVSQMHARDSVAACYSAVRTYADAGPARTITIIDLRTVGYYGTLIGTW